MARFKASPTPLGGDLQALAGHVERELQRLGSQPWDGVPFIARTAAEIAAGVTPVNFAYPPGHRSRYSTLADAVAVSATHALHLYADESVAATVTLPSGAHIIGYDRPQITCTAAGVPILEGNTLTGATIRGVRFKGKDSSTVPSGAFGGFAAANRGLVTIANSTNVRVIDCEFDTFYNGLTVEGSSYVWVLHNDISNFQSSGCLFSSSNNVECEFNRIHDCTQTGGVVAYGVQMTGDNAGGSPTKNCSVSFNRIEGIPSWDGIGSHDVSQLRVIGNTILGVRTGIDLGHLGSTNVVANLAVIGNYIESTDTDTWAGSEAAHAGIAIVGFDGTHLVDECVIAGNAIRSFFDITGMVTTSQSHNIVVTNVKDVAVTGNTVLHVGSITNSGLYVNGTVDRLAVCGNSFQGTLAHGGIRLESVTADLVCIAGNVVSQDTTTDTAILITGSTLSLALGRNVSNSSTHFSQSSSTITLAGEELEGSATYDPPSLADGAGTTTTVSVSGAAVGDFAVASFGGDIAGLTVTAYVSAADTVSVRLQNESGTTVDLGSATLRVRVLKHH